MAVSKTTKTTVGVKMTVLRQDRLYKVTPSVCLFYTFCKLGYEIIGNSVVQKSQDGVTCIVLV